MTYLIIGAALLFLFIIYILAGLISFCLMTHNIKAKSKASKERALNVDLYFGDKIKEGVECIKYTPFEEWQIVSFDNLKLYGRFFKNGDSNRTIILFHGFRSSGEHDFSCAFKMYFDRGFNILIPDQRAHGKSEGRYICYGVLERFDVIKWIEKVNTELKEKQTIFLSGVSMGATTVLMASGLDMPENVKGIVADCGFTSPQEIIKKVMHEDMHIPIFPLYNGAELAARLIAHCDFSCSTLEALKMCKVPILFIHGRADDFVPFYMGEQNFGACVSDKNCVWVDKAGHGTSFLFETERCVKAFNELIK